jgi:hypothetical protein
VFEAILTKVIAGLRDGGVVPYLGPGVLADVVNSKTGEPMPADSDSLILAMNNGKPMAPRLMFEFSRAAMNLELKRGRRFINNWLVKTYGETIWSRAALHEQLKYLKPPYVVDINRDTQLQDSYQDTPHTLIVGVARISARDYRFRIYAYDGNSYREIEQNAVDLSRPVLFKPLGTPRPEPSFIASDADFVDYITELMGGFAIPTSLKEYRRNKQYLILGLRFQRDTERMVLSDITYGAGDPRGWILLPEATPKERRFCERLGIDIIPLDLKNFLAYLENNVV